MSDTLEFFGQSVLQHGKESDRVYLMKLDKKDFPAVLGYINELAQREGYSKIIAKVHGALEAEFIKDGYRREAFIKSFYCGREDCCLMAKYPFEGRALTPPVPNARETAAFYKTFTAAAPPKEIAPAFNIRALAQADIPVITGIYKKVFDTYPFPVFEGGYIAKTMREDVDYFGIFDGGILAAICSAEMDRQNQNAEMTDFAALPQYRGKSLSYFLLKAAEESAAAKGIKTFYTIARHKNTGVNIVFAKSGYKFGGLLGNNTNICGGIESMNVWFKKLY